VQLNSNLCLKNEPKKFNTGKEDLHQTLDIHQGGGDVSHQI